MVRYIQSSYYAVITECAHISRRYYFKFLTKVDDFTIDFANEFGIPIDAVQTSELATVASDDRSQKYK